MARPAGGIPGQLDGDDGAFNCFAEIEGYFGFDIGPPRRLRRARSRPAAVEKTTEDIPKATFSSKSRSALGEEVREPAGRAVRRRAKPAREARASVSAKESAGADKPR